MILPAFLCIRLKCTHFHAFSAPDTLLLICPKRYADISEEIRSAVDHIVDPSLERGSTGQSSSIIKVGLDYSIEIIRK